MPGTERHPHPHPHPRHTTRNTPPVPSNPTPTQNNQNKAGQPRRTPTKKNHKPRTHTRQDQGHTAKRPRQSSFSEACVVPVPVLSHAGPRPRPRVRSEFTCLSRRKPARPRTRLPQWTRGKPSPTPARLGKNQRGDYEAFGECKPDSMARSSVPRQNSINKGLESLGADLALIFSIGPIPDGSASSTSKMAT